MHTRLFLILSVLCAAAPLGAQDAGYSTTPFAPQQFAPEQLDQLVSPIALYPDPLLGAILPASTHPGDLASAASLLAANPDPSQIDLQPWDESVKVVAHYPGIASWMATNATWTSQLGTAVIDQQPDVLDAIQRLRANARASGMLVDTPQQRVVMQGNLISIVPAQPDVVYVPSYDAQYLYRPTPGAEFGITFGTGYPLGPWDDFGLDWSSRSVWFDRDHRRDWDRTRTAVAPPPSRERWEPSRTEPRPRYSMTTPTRRSEVSHPSRYTERSGRWTDNVGRTPTGRIASPAMEYNQPAPRPVPPPLRTTQPQVQSSPRNDRRAHDKDDRRDNDAPREKKHHDDDDRAPDR